MTDTKTFTITIDPGLVDELALLDALMSEAWINARNAGEVEFDDEGNASPEQARAIDQRAIDKFSSYDRVSVPVVVDIVDDDTSPVGYRYRLTLPGDAIGID